MCDHSINGHSLSKKGARRWPLWLLPFAGLLSLTWFLIRVVPKPSRAAYPCQQVAAPLASGFVVWLTGVVTSLFALRKGKSFLRQSRTTLAWACLTIALATGALTLMTMPQRLAMADAVTPNQPVGVAKGIHPGRVVWVHDPNATDWLGPGDGHLWESDHTDQVAVDRMLRLALLGLTAEDSEAEAWDALFHHFNVKHGNSDLGYLEGEKIAIKVNLVGCLGNGWGGVDPDTYDLVRKMDYMNTSPQMMLALLRQLVNVAGVDPADISIGDPVALFPNQYYQPLHDEFPEVSYLDARGDFGRTAVTPSAVDFHWSAHPTLVAQDKVLTSFAEAKYFINLANMKSHSMAGITLCGKNYYGWLRMPPEAGYYDMHASLPAIVSAEANYRCIVDLMGHAHSGGKALVYLVDGLYAGVHPDDDVPITWDVEPFNGDWTSSVFASQDPVAIDSVGFDLLQQEGDPRVYPQMAGADDYLHEAALADDPPSGTYYDPDHTGDFTRLSSLGVHEHWNNPQEKLYSRNLDPVNGQGIELVIADPAAVFSDGFETSDTSGWSSTMP
jgi:hypothetical protein